MINLIPPEGQKSVRREYTLRVVSTMSLLFGCVVLLLAIAHIPTYVLIDAQIEALALVTEVETEKGEAVKRAEEEVLFSQTLLTQLRSTEERPSLMEVVAEIEDKASSAVTLRNFILESGAESKKLEKIQVQGVAATREALAGFKTAIEESEQFSGADIPIADLARDEDLPFTVTITLTEPL